MKLLSLQIGQPRSVTDPAGGTWSSAIFKEAVTGPVMIGPEGIEGDGQADRRVHGGPDKAVNVYPHEHYAFWRERLGLNLEAGAFGENFTLAGALEDAVCIGDVFRCGEVVLEVSQPRQPCWKLARRWGVKELPALVQETGHTGWYLRVLQGGSVAAPATWERSAQPFPEWTVAGAAAVMFQRAGGAAAAAALAACPALAGSWRQTLSNRASVATA